ncbi:MAG: ATP-dependent protease ATPase subunit HslU [Alphaproteobacteria bacterium]
MTTDADLTPKAIVAELDRYIVGQAEAKRAVANALRNRWRRKQLEEPLKSEVLPKNILMIGPTGVGKTEIARRLAKLVNAPFIKVEATKFTEVGYVGRDVEQIIRDLLEMAIVLVRQTKRTEILSWAEAEAEERVLDALVGEAASHDTREKFRTMLRDGKLNDRDIEIDVKDVPSAMKTFDIPGMPGAQMGMMNLGDILGKSFGAQTKKKKTTVRDSYEYLIADACESLMDDDDIIKTAIVWVEQNGIVFLDEVDKICARSEMRGGDVSREGVQRDLLPLIEGTVVSTKHGQVKTDHILFIASGAFHLAKPSDLLPELQGRLPIRVELQALTRQDFCRILTEPECSLIKQYVALLNTENVSLVFTEEAIERLAELATDINASVENIGARRLHTLLERLTDDISYNATDHAGTSVTLDIPYVNERLASLAKNTDLSRFVL